MRLEIIIAGGKTEMNVIDEKIIEEALNKYGVEKQLLVCMEEPAELIQAISKAERYPNDEKYIDRLIEEIADVLICIEYLKKIYDIDQSKIEKWESKKLKRVLKRMNEV